MADNFKLKVPQLTETDILRQVRHFLQLMGWLVVRHQQGIGSHKGFPDLTAYKDAITLMIEIKKPSGRLSEHQEKFRDSIRRAGHPYLVVRSVEEMREALQTIRICFPGKDGREAITMQPHKGMEVKCG